MYDYFGMALTPDTKAAMASYMNNDPKKTTYGVHKYSLQEFSLTIDEIKEEFKEYIENNVENNNDRRHYLILLKKLDLKENVYIYIHKSPCHFV